MQLPVGFCNVFVLQDRHHPSTHRVYIAMSCVVAQQGLCNGPHGQHCRVWEARMLPL